MSQPPRSKFEKVKSDALEELLDDLLQDYQVATKQWSWTTSAADKLSLKRQITAIEAEIRQIEDELVNLGCGKIGTDVENSNHDSANSEGGGTVPLEAPHPWAGVEQSAIPVARPMYDVEAERLGTVPLDLGTMWGLDRGSFIGLLLTTQDTRLCDHLKNVERVLYEAQVTMNHAVRLPARWWIEVDPEKFPYGPQRAHHVGEAATKDSDPLATFVAASGFPSGTIPGVLLRLSEQETSQHISAIAHWCRALISNEFVSPAVLVVIEGRNVEAIRAQAARLTFKLQNIGVPVEMMRLSRSLAQNVQTIRDGTHVPNAQAGFALFCWLRELLAENSDWRRQEDDYPEVITFLSDLEKKFSDSVQQLPQVDAQSVVADFDQCIPERSDFHRQFLRLHASAASDKLPTMIAAYAKSRWPYARREALIAALRPGISAEVDVLMDAWVTGSELDPKRFPRDTELFSDPEYGSFTVALALAVLRQTDSAPDATGCILGQLFLPDVLNHVRAQRVKADDASLDDFLKTFGAEEYLLAVRAGVEMVFPLAHYPDLSSVWRLLPALLPNKERTAELLTMDIKYRAIVGLLTDEEWKAVHHDEGMKRWIVDHRHGHPVYRHI